MPYTLKEAAEAVGMGKPAVLKAIQKGRISGTKDEHGQWQIEPAELHRVYPPVAGNASDAASKVIEATIGNTQGNTNGNGLLTQEIDFLREQLATVAADRERERRDAESNIEDLRRRLDQSENERREKDQRLTALLSDQTQKPEPPPLQTKPVPVPSTDKGMRGWLAKKLWKS